MRTKASFPPQIVGFYVSGRRAAHPLPMPSTLFGALQSSGEGPAGALTIGDGLRAVERSHRKAAAYDLLP